MLGVLGRAMPGGETVRLAPVLRPVSYTHLDVYKRQSSRITQPSRRWPAG